MIFEDGYIDAQAHMRAEKDLNLSSNPLIPHQSKS